jgi:hypothetical protein
LPVFLIKEYGISVFSPLSYFGCLRSHDPSAFERYKHKDYMDMDLTMLQACQQLWILPLPGWKGSKGIREELDFCEGYDIPYAILPINASSDALPTDLAGGQALLQNLAQWHG